MEISINRDRLLKNFLEYTAIDSESGNEAAMASRVAADLEALGCPVRTDETGNVIALFAGEAPALIMCAHMDTVAPGRGVRPVITDGLIHTDGSTVLGGDDKSGIAAIVEAIRTAKEAGLPHRTIEAVFTVREETGMTGSKALDYEKLSAKEAVVFDSGGDAGKIITAAPGQTKIRAEIKGVAAHAGVAPEKGVSAIQAGAAAVSAMKLLRIDEETTANIGTFTAVGATNIVSPSAFIEAEARSRDNAKLEAQTKHMTECLEDACRRFGAKLDCRVSVSYKGYALPADDPLTAAVEQACRRLGIVPVTAASGGGSDANVLNAAGIKAVVLGTGMDKVHTTSERITVKNLEDTARIALELMTLRQQ
ncbi:MAG: M20/M25/M40 family metallo-hydrolase [Synergistes sp.]|nr:M20/M25/M40 family metallo-hydrolase [Synergistes sp.]